MAEAPALLAARAAAIAHAAASGGASEIADRLSMTVIRPLRELAPDADGARAEAPGDLAAALLDLAADLTRACATDDRAALLEACAGAHRLVADADAPVERLAALAAEIPTPSEGRVRVRRDGPYLVTGGPDTTDWLGIPAGATPVTALCRCGRSGRKPWCDGTHAEVGFSDTRHDDRQPDRLDRYEARQFAITDNRGTCAHSGRCTDALPTVFRQREEPFVAPAGGRADDILRAVQACPSGALGVAIHDRRAAELADPARPPSISVSKDGPYYVTGGVALDDDAGAPVPRNAGASPEHYALCRCGQSKNKPFCSGAHWYADFHDPVPDPEREPTLFEWAGGYPALLRMTTLFYERHVPEDPLLAPLFARMAPDHPERVAAWLSEVFGGPALYSARYGGYGTMIAHHLGKHLTEEQRARWVALLSQSASEALLPNDAEFRAAFAAYLEWGSRIAVENSTDGAVPPEGLPVPRWWWVCDATPAARVSALADPADAPAEPVAEPPVDGEPLSFERHVKGLFRARDRAAMRFAFDLWDADDVRRHADAIAARLRNGTMPCDGPWPDDRIAVFERWASETAAPG